MKDNKLSHVDGQWRAEDFKGRRIYRMRVGPFDCMLEADGGQFFGRVTGFGGLLAWGHSRSRLQGMADCEAACAGIAGHVLEVLGSPEQKGRRYGLR